MLYSLPEAGPDESVYGIVTRYLRRLTPEPVASASGTGWCGVEQVTQYGLCDAPRIVRAGYGDPEPVLRRLYTEHSLMPYALAAFLPQRREQVRSILLSGKARNREMLAEVCLIPIRSRHSALGLRWCPECYQEERRSAQSRWKRVQQLPGTTVCIKHATWLSVTNGPVRRKICVSPADLAAGEIRPRRRSRPSAEALAMARLDEAWLEHSAELRLESLRYRLQYELALRTRARWAAGYPDGWRVFCTDGFRRFRERMWNTGATALAAMEPSRIVRAIFRLGKRDVQAATILPALLYFGIALDEVQSLDWGAVYNAHVATVAPASRLRDPLQRELVRAAREAQRLVRRRERAKMPRTASKREVSEPERRRRERYSEKQKEVVRRKREMKLAMLEEAKRERRSRNREEANELARRWRARNPEKARECGRRWRARNQEKWKEQTRRRRERNAEKIREHERRWRARNPEKVREYGRRWRERNPEKVREYGRRWRERNREKVREYGRRRRELNRE